MMRWILTVCALVAVGCGERKPPEKAVFDPARQAIEKARGVEQTLQDGALKRDEQLQRSETQEK